MHDAHVHPQNLFERDPDAEKTRRRLGIAAAASAWNREEYEFHRELAAAARHDGAAPLFLCFAVHPQAAGEDRRTIQDSLDALAEYAAAGELAAIGECGFDCMRRVHTPPPGAITKGMYPEALYLTKTTIPRRTAGSNSAAGLVDCMRRVHTPPASGGVVDFYNETYRATETEQERLFAVHLETALRYGLPLVLHIRRAMHKIFPYTKELKKLPAVAFHSWPGSAEEGFSLLRRGINAYFSFGTAIMLNHKNAIRSCAAFPADRLLFETDAPWQPLRGKPFSSWEDICVIVNAAAALRNTSAAELERTGDANFYRVFSPAYCAKTRNAPY